MSRYAMNKVLWTYGRDPEYHSSFDRDPTTTLASEDIDAAERGALIGRDIRALFSLGAHPFLVYSFAIQVNGGWSYPFMLDYVERLRGLELCNIET